MLKVGIRSQSPADRASRALAFLLFAGLTIYYALRGGSYDSVVWQQEAIVVWWVIGLGFALGVLPRTPLSRGLAVSLLAIGLLTGWTALGLVWTASDEQTLEEVGRVVHFAGILLIVWSVLDRRTVAPAIGGLAAGALAVCGLAVASRLFPGPFPADAVSQALDLDRLNYPLGYWNALAAFAAMGLAMALVLSAHSRSLAARAAVLAAVPLCGLAVYLTYSRGGVLSVLLAVVATLMLSRNRWVAAVHAVAAGAGTAMVILVASEYPAVASGAGGDGGVEVLLALLVAALISGAAAVATRVARGDERWRLPPVAGRIATGAAVVIGLLLAVGFDGERASQAWDEFREQSVGSTPAEVEAQRDSAARLTSLGGQRYEYWTAALDALGSHPVTGIGPGTFEFWWNRTGGVEFIRDAHSLYLEQAAELGVIGLVLTALLLVTLGVVALKRRAVDGGSEAFGARTAAVAAFAVFLFHAGIDWLWESTAVAALALAAVAAASVPLVDPAAARRWPLRVVVPVVALVAVLIQLPGLASISSIRESQAAFRAGDIETAVAKATDAVETQPWAASPYVQRALLAEATGRLSDARAAALAAIEREPVNWRHFILLARVEAKRGAVDEAVAAYREAVRLRPNSIFLQPPAG